MALDANQLGGIALFLGAGLFLILTRRFWADLAAKSIWKMNPKTMEKVCLFGGTLFVLIGLLGFVAEPVSEVVEVEEPSTSCATQLFGALFGLGFGLYGVINHRVLAEKAKEHFGNTDLLAKGYLIIGIMFILFGLIAVTGVYELCLGRRL